MIVTNLLWWTYNQFIELYDKEVDVLPEIHSRGGGAARNASGLVYENLINTVHYVNDELDGGEIIKQAKVPIFETDTVQELTKRIQREEYRILPEVINKLPWN